MDTELYQLELAIDQIGNKAAEFGLDFFPMRFELCPADVLYTIGAYGMPTRFTHWSFGKNYFRLKTMYDYNLSRIYELVVNSNPCYAFLLEGNTLIQNKLVIAHVFAHCDFFKNNAWFAKTNRDMIETMSVNAEQIREYEFLHGQREVEKILDSALAIQEHIDFYQIVKEKEEPEYQKKCQRENPYEDIWSIGEGEKEEVSPEEKRFPLAPEKDIMGFVMTNSHSLKDWQRDLLAMLREEMFYFWPQVETKIMNEGWAAYWHARILRAMDLSDEETLEFARLHASVLQTSRSQLNPYFLGMKIFEDIEKRWDKPSPEDQLKYDRRGGEGRDKIFEVRQMENDQSFLRNYLTQDLVRDLDLYLFKKQGSQWKVSDTEWEAVRDGIVGNLVNGGHPYLTVEDGNFRGNGNLYILHHHEGVDLDTYYLERTLPYVYDLWGKTVHLETILEERSVLFSFDGKKHTRTSS
ncbi:SpoVR family protein [Dehalobacterium formicoaceticum]|uniref:SpoVR family protein n=1 Tax=Dehalobacterium formicoaceticum TaxID=51515 RepID=A0ABT1Y3F7_9FIRM|nr:SpoVR family protein [Dehalobacterium formicoaceticum]MCR6545026.1 SpoVR family protein [Dehalobacterium formicoaceticum]